MSTTLQKLGNKIREHRQAKGYSQEELAFRAGLHRAYIGGVERGERNITVLTLEKIAEALESSLDTFLTS
jgi:transcriptional regulator with XRE-family HTH domain